VSIAKPDTLNTILIGTKDPLTEQQQLIPPEPESLFGDEFRNEYGSIRNCFVRSHYFTDQIVLEDVVDLFREWKDDSEYFILRSVYSIHQETFKRDASSYLGNVGIINNYITDYKYKFIKASKRGNDVYRYLVNKKLNPLSELSNVTFFKDDWGVKQTSLLFVTLTYDTNRCDVNTAWANIGDEYHLFINNLRKQYGHIEVFRTWESTKGYYPHVHALIGFKDNSFHVHVHTDKNKKRSFRIPTNDKNKISTYWHSHIDVQGVNNTEDAIDELTKYITKDLCSNKGNKTNSMIWLFRKQSYSVSKGFVGLIKGQFAEVMESAKVEDVKSGDLIKDLMSNCNRDVEKWEFVGILRGVQLGFSSCMWSIDIKKPPPRVVDLLINEHNRWNALHGGFN